MKIGLVLEGGAMRGMYTAGVLDTFLDQHILLDGVIGISAGAVFGVNYLSGQKGRVIRYNQRFNGDRRYMGLGSLLKTGNIVNTEFAYGTVPKTLDPFDDQAFQDSGIPFYCGMTNLDTGKAEYVQIKSGFAQMDALRASASMPFVSKPVRVGNQWYLDGGVADSIPYQKMLSLGYEKLVVILTRDRSYRKKAMSPALIQLCYGKKKAFAEDLKRRHVEYNESVQHLEALEQQGTAFVIRPSEPITIRRMEKDPKELYRVYQMGLRDAEQQMQGLRQFLKQAEQELSNS